jgi:hypothetical protein
MAILLKKTNFSKSKLAGSLAIGGTSFNCTASEGAKFPTIGSGYPFRAVIWGASYSTPESDATREIVECYQSATDTFTITIRGAEGTSAKAWSANDNFALVMTASVIAELETEINTKQSLTWNSISASTTAAVRNAYLITGGTTIVTLPTTAAVGDKIIVSNQGNANPTSAKVVPGTGGTIVYTVPSLTAVNTTGYIALQRYSSIELTCIVANTTWEMSSGAGIYSIKPTSTSPIEISDVTRGASYAVYGNNEITADTTLYYSTYNKTINSIFANKGTLLTLTLDTTDASTGQIYKIIGRGAGGWKIAVNGASNTIRFGNLVTTTGTGGYIASTNPFDCVEIICTFAQGDATTTWQVISSTGNITIV